MTHVVSSRQLLHLSMEKKHFMHTPYLISLLNRRAIRGWDWISCCSTIHGQTSAKGPECCLSSKRGIKCHTKGIRIVTTYWLTSSYSLLITLFVKLPEMSFLMVYLQHFTLTPIRMSLPADNNKLYSKCLDNQEKLSPLKMRNPKIGHHQGWLVQGSWVQDGPYISNWHVNMWHVQCKIQCCLFLRVSKNEEILHRGPLIYLISHVKPHCTVCPHWYLNQAHRMESP